MSETNRRIDDRYATHDKYATLRGIRRDARQHLSDAAWNYLWCGTGDEVTLAANTAAFDRYLFDPPLFAGISNPDTRTNVLGFDLAFPAFIAPFGGDAVFHPDGHLAIGRAAEAAGIRQMVPVAASFPLEDIARASSAASVFQMTFVGDEGAIIAMMERAKAAGYRFICVTDSPIRQWRERMMEDRFSIRGEKAPANFGPGLSDPASLVELLDFTRPRWTWQQAARAIARAPLPCIVKGVTRERDAKAALDAGAVGLYVSNYGGRTIDRTPAAIDTLAGRARGGGARCPDHLRFRRAAWERYRDSDRARGRRRGAGPPHRAWASPPMASMACAGPSNSCGASSGRPSGIWAARRSPTSPRTCSTGGLCPDPGQSTCPRRMSRKPPISMAAPQARKPRSQTIH